jgi:hypothetical protein
MIKFEKKGYYEMEADRKKNHFRISVFGSWQDPNEVPDYIPQVKESLQEMDPGFTCLVHIDDEKPPKLTIQKLQRQCQKEIMNAGVKRTAVVLPKRKILQRVSLNVISYFTGIEMELFETKDDAFKWLDTKSDG